MNRNIVYAISASPPTWGHADIMQRAAKKFDHLYWVVGVNASKAGVFSTECRKKMMQAYVDYYGLDNVTVDSHEGVIARYAQEKEASFLLRGLRSTSDFHYERELSTGNRGIAKEIETICLFSRPHYATISSSLIRELASLGEGIDQYVLPSIIPLIKEGLKVEK